MSWEKLGLLIGPPAGLDWSATHAAVPAVDVGPDGSLTVYFTTRDERGRSHVARATVDLAAGTAEVDNEPVLRPGPLGAFDDSGVMTSCVVRRDDEVRLYYTGWSLRTSVPFHLAIGCAVSRDGGRTFERHADGPIVDRSSVDPFLTASPFVLADGDAWRMWYVSGTGWTTSTEGPPAYRVLVKHAVSIDGLGWQRDGEVAIDHRLDAGEYAIGRPWVIHGAHGHHMWFSHRGAAYRLGYAQSDDGRSWLRDDASVLGTLEPSADGWDAEMVEYPAVFEHAGERWMLYNGRAFGASGIGLARWRSDSNL